MLEKFVDSLKYTDPQKQRLMLRHKHIIDPIITEIAGASVIDLGSHDGRWPVAFRDAGAASVVGIEGRQEMVRQFTDSDEGKKPGVELRVGDFVDGMDDLLAEGRTFDIVSCLGVYYHTMQHYRMMLQMVAFRPKLIIIDTEVWKSPGAMIGMSMEATGRQQNSTAQVEGQDRAPVGIPSFAAIDRMAGSVGYSATTIEWDVPPGQRGCVMDYFGSVAKHRKHLIRKTIHLRPVRTNSLIERWRGLSEQFRVFR